MTLTAQQCRMARATLNIGVRELAECADVSPNTIARLERGEALHRRTLAHVRGVLEAQGVFFVSDRGAVWPGPVVGYAPGRSLSGRAKLFSDLCNLPGVRHEPAAAYDALLNIFEAYLDIIQAEGREPDTWERLNLKHAADDFRRSDLYSAYTSIRIGITPPDNQAKDYPISAEDTASVATCDLASFREAVPYLRSKGYIERYPQEVAPAG
jgi:transcriptional regulator with XRE-family HTH domain